MTTTKTPRTDNFRKGLILNVRTGKRSWNIRLLERKTSQIWEVETVRKDGKPGKAYRLNIFTKALSATRKTRNNGERLYKWGVTELEGRTRWDWRRPLAALAPAEKAA